MSDIQIVISEQENISLEIAPSSDSVVAFNQPVVPALEVVVGGVVTNVFQGSGGAQVLNDLTDVNAGSGANQGEILYYDAVNLEWRKGTYSDIAGIPNLSAVATSGSYNDLTDTPTISNFSGSYNDLTDTPSLFDGNYNSLTNTPSIPTELNDLSDVDLSTAAPSHGQVLKFDSGSSTFKPADDESSNVSGGGGGTVDELDDIGNVQVSTASQFDFLMYNGLNWINVNPKIDQQIVVSNTADALGNAVGQTYAAGTDIITILTDILTDYYQTDITLTNLKVQLQGTDGNYGATTTTTGLTREIGAGVKVVGFNFTIGNNAQTNDTSVSLKRGSTVIESGLSDTALSPNLQAGNIQTHDPSTPQSFSYKAHAVDDGSGSDIPIQSDQTRTIAFKYRVRVGTATTETISSDAEATTLFGQIGDLKDALMNEQSFTVSGNSDTANSSNFFWIAYPAAFGFLNDILLGAVGSLVDFDVAGAGPLQFNVTNDFGVSTSYYFYRTDSPGSVSANDNVTIQF